MNYLREMDVLIKDFINSNSDDEKLYIYGQVHYYEPISFITEASFFCSFYALKIQKTTIILEDKSINIKAHFTDQDIRYIISQLKTESTEFYKYLVGYRDKILSNKGLSTIEFELNGKHFNCLGIPFNKKFDDVFCTNPSDIKLNGNDLIGLINLIFEKERTDKDKKKVQKTCNYYFYF